MNKALTALTALTALRLIDSSGKADWLVAALVATLVRLAYEPSWIGVAVVVLLFGREAAERAMKDARKAREHVQHTASAAREASTVAQLAKLENEVRALTQIANLQSMGKR